MFEVLTSMLSAGASTAAGAAADEPVGGEGTRSDVEAAMGRIEALLDDELDDADERDALASAIRAEVESLASPERGSASASLAGEGTDAQFSLAQFVEGIPNPTIVLDGDGTVLAYNTASKRQLGFDDDHDDFIGRQSRETIADAVYTDGSRTHTLPDKVVENPRDAATAWDVDDESHEYPLSPQTVYADTSVSKTSDGAVHHIYMTAVPVFDDDGDPEMVVEVVHDRSEEMARREAVAALVAEVTDTIGAFADGDLSARASFEDEAGVVEPELLELPDELNRMATAFEALVERVDENADDLAASIDRASESAFRIDEQVTEQNESLASVAREMEEFSATMEEMAASSKEVADAADEALSAADRGVEAGQEARAAADEVRERSQSLVETVDELDGYMEEIGAVAEVISDVAEQTNLLALNANIEAARAGESGQGFAVVADEVKALAEETQRQTGEIAERIEAIQVQTGQTVEEVEASHEQIESVDEEIGSSVDALHTISSTVDQVASGIQDVASANDQQAVAVEEVTATAEDARDNADAVSETVDDIVEEAEVQERAVAALADSVHELTAGGRGDSGEGGEARPDAD